MRRSSRFAALLCLITVHAAAQLADRNPDWQESEAPKPPVPQTGNLIPIEVPGANLRYGVDPASVSLGADGIVRYVVVATSSTGAMNASYEGIRCNSGDFRVYARFNREGGWSPSGDVEWRPLHDGRPFRHSLTVARTGACMGRGANRSVDQILRDLRSPVDRRFNNPGT
jgi:hypothetical protein